MNNHDKGTFLQEFYGVKNIPDLKDKEGNPTKFAEAAKFWGEAIPETINDVKMLVSKGAALVATENLSVSQKFSQNSVYGGRQELSLLRPNQIKVPFVKTGAWKHDVYGEVKFTESDINQLVENFKNDVVGFTPYLTLGHLDEEHESTDSHRKRGDLKDIVVEGETAYGIFEVNDEIYASIEKGEYEYSSGEFNRKFTDKQSGKDVGTAVIRVALTNSPFLPFGNEKVQALSDNAESCPETKENYVFLLSIDTSNSSNVSDEDKAVEPKVEEAKVEEVKTEEPQALSETAEVAPVESEDINNTEPSTLNNKQSIMPKDKSQAAPVEANVAPAAVEKVEDQGVEATKLETATEAVTVKDSDPSKTEKTPNQGDDVIANLTSQLAKIQEMYASQLEAANATIKELGDKVAGLTDKLAGQEKVTQAFSTSMSQAQEAAMIQDLQLNGVQPATVQKFLAFKNSFEKADNKNIVKFSVTAGEETKEVEQTVIDTVADMLKTAAGQAPLVEQQLGYSAGRKSGQFDFSSIIERNAEAATKLKA